MIKSCLTKESNNLQTGIRKDGRNMKKILVIIPDLKSGGAERSLVNFLNECDYSEYDVDLLLFSKTGAFLSQIPSDVSVVQNPLLSSLFSKSKKEIHEIRKEHLFTYCYAQLIKVVGTIIGKLVALGDKYKSRQYRWNLVYRWLIPNNANSYDIAMAYLEGEATYYLADKISTENKISWVHNDYNKLGYDSRLDRRIFEKINSVVTISDECVRSLKKTFSSLSNRVYRLENITSEKFIYKKSKEFIPQEYNKLIKILSVGRLTPQKGFDFAIDAARILDEIGLDFCWYFIGEGRLRGELKQKIELYKLEEKVKLLGVKENPYPYIAGCDIFVQTSRYEGKSVVLDEAKILSKPIVSTNYSTVYDQIKDGDEGIIVEQNAESIAAGIRLLIDDYSKRKHLMEYLKSHHYGNEQCISGYYKLFNGVTE